MSSTNDVLSALLAEFKTLNGRISTLESAVAAKTSVPASVAVGKVKGAKKAKKERDPDAPKREPTAWRLFADRVRAVLKDNGFSGNALGTECVQFASSLKDENADFSSWTDADIIARRSAWAKPEVSKGELKGGKGWAKTGERRAASKSGSVVSGDADGDAADADGAESAKKARKNPWAGLTPEQRAERIQKMKDGKAAKKAAADGGASSDDAAPSVVAAPKKAESAPAPAKKADAPPKPSATASASSGDAASGGEFKKVMLNGALYWVNMENGHTYHRLADQSQGEWAGIFSKTPKPHLDDTVPEPGSDDQDDELNFDE
jgi:hypothetical protein